MAGIPRCSLDADDLDAVLAAIPVEGGSVVSSIFAIERIGRFAFFEDTDANRVAAMQYDSDYPP